MTWSIAFRGSGQDAAEHIRANDQRADVADFPDEVIVLHGTPQQGEGAEVANAIIIPSTGRAGVCYGGGTIWGDYGHGFVVPDDPDGLPIPLIAI